MSADRIAAIDATIDQLDRVRKIMVYLKRNSGVSEVDAMAVRRLIRMLVEEWV